MKGNEHLKDKPKLASNRRKGVFIAFALLALLFTFIFIDSSLYQENQTSNNSANLVSFFCRSSSSNQTFTINVDVNLTDNMDQGEAIRVALKVYAQCKRLQVTPSTYFSWAAYTSDEGTWVVKLDIVSLVLGSYCAQRRLTLIHREDFMVIINPSSRTIVYIFDMR